MTRKINLSFAFVLMAMLSPLALAAEPLTAYVSYMDGSIDIAPDGSVQSYSLPGLLGSSDRTLVHAIDKRVRSWRFIPAAEKGQPVVAHMRFGLKLQADAGDNGKNFVVSLAKVDFYDQTVLDSAGNPRVRLAPPSYPGSPMRAGVGANVKVIFEIDDTGHVLETGVSEIELLLPGPLGRSDEANYARNFREAVLLAAKDWQFPASYHNGACGSPCLLAVPVRFIPCDCSSEIAWSGSRPILLPPLPWAMPQATIVQYDMSGAPASTHKLVDPGQAEGQL